MKLWNALKGWKLIIGNMLMLVIAPAIPNPAVSEVVKQVGQLVTLVGAADRLHTNLTS